MPSPVTPSDFDAVVPGATSDLCSKFKLVLLTFPRLVSEFMNWFLNSDGTISDAALADINPFVAGDYKQSASPNLQTGDWLLCDGQAISRADFPALFLAIGTTYGDGDGSTTFNKPDMQDAVLVGASGTKSIGSTGGSNTVTLVDVNIPAHVHQVAYGVTSQGAGANITNDVPIGGTHDSGRTDTTSFGGSPPTAVNIQNKYVAGYWYIKT